MVFLTVLRVAVLCSLAKAYNLRASVKSCVQNCFNGSFPLFVECPSDTSKFKQLLNCFTGPWYPNTDDPSDLPENSRLPDTGVDVKYCKTTYGRQFCRFSGTNYLEPTHVEPLYYYNCGGRTCDFMLVPHEAYQRECLHEFFSNNSGVER